jgi:hypothetical protein
MDSCTKCGSKRVEPGTLGSAAVWLDKQSAWSRALAGAQVKLIACMDCGHLELSASPDDLRKLVE